MRSNHGIHAFSQFIDQSIYFFQLFDLWWKAAGILKQREPDPQIFRISEVFIKLQGFTFSWQIARAWLRQPFFNPLFN